MNIHYTCVNTYVYIPVYNHSTKYISMVHQKIYNYKVHVDDEKTML